MPFFVFKGEYIVHPFLKACYLAQSSKCMNLLLCFATLVSFFFLFLPYLGFKTELHKHNISPFLSDVNHEMDCRICMVGVSTPTVQPVIPKVHCS